VAKRGNKAVGQTLVRDYKDPDVCPVATTDGALNIKNRNLAIKNHGYGPMNPDEPNEKYWKGIAELWGISPEEAKASRCGNCAAFVQTPVMLACIADHIGFDEDYPSEDALRENQAEVREASDLGYCQAFGFKCAADRTCRAWLYGGPIT
jgi:hypothetical protein